MKNFFEDFRQPPLTFSERNTMKTLKPAKTSVIIFVATLASLTILVLALVSPLAVAQDMQALPPIAAQWMNAWNSKDPRAMADLFTEDGSYEDLAFQAKFQGKEGVAAWVQLTADIMPDLNVEITDAFQSGDKIAVRWTFTGTPLSLGPIQGTGKTFSVPAASIIEVKDGRIASVTDFYNLANLFRQLGLDAGDWVPPGQ
jgi:steroid delta-isomerase-like uncharacterized protein